MKQLIGCGTALLTPFKEDGSVDYEAFAATVDRQVASGIHFLVPLGTTGETPCLTAEERVEILKITKEHSQGLPIVVGGGTNSFEDTCQSMALLEPYGVDYFLIVVPYYNKPTQQGIYEYYKAVAAATEKPIVVYNVPGRTGANITAETTLALAKEVKNIVAIKEASGNYAQISRIIKDKPEGFSVLSGNDDETLSLMATGGQGVISVASNIVPDKMVALVEALQQDNMPLARQIHYQLMPLFKNCFVESNPIPAKAAMAQLGLMKNVLRLPMTAATESTIELMKVTLAEL